LGLAVPARRKAARPIAENRAEYVERLWRDGRKDLAQVREYLRQRSARAEYYLQARDIAGIGIAFMQRSRDIMRLALVGAHDGESGWQQLLREAFSLMYWSAEILQHERAAQRVGPEQVDGFLLERIWLHGLAAGGGACGIADWTARYLGDILAATGGHGNSLELEQDRPYSLFLGLLVDASVRGSWPKAFDRGVMRAYGELLASAGRPEAFRQAVVSFCDFRLAQAFGYDGAEAARRRSGAVTGSVLDAGGWIKVFPVELLSLTYVYEKTTTGTLSLEADHPLLATAPMNLPALLPLHDDDFLRGARALASKVFGNAWRPLALASPI
jgi:hypothetical protein